MNSTFKYSPSNRKTNGLQWKWRWLVQLSLLSLLVVSEATFADVFVTQVSGDVSVKLKGFPSAMGLKAGTWLPADAKLEVASDSVASVLCLVTGESLSLSPKANEPRGCATKSARTMRSSGNEDIPVVLIPNQQALERLTRLVWTGPEDGRFALTVIKYDADGFETVFEEPEWNDLHTQYSESGIHEHRLKEPWKLHWSEDEYYEVIITNLNNSRSSNEDEDYSSQIIMPVPEGLIQEVRNMVPRQLIDKDPGLADLTTAAQLVARGYQTQAYGLLQEVNGEHWKVTKQLVRARALRIPGVPPSVMVREYGSALAMAAKTNDKLNAAIACRELQGYLDLLPSGGDIYMSLTTSPEFSEHCSQPRVPASKR